jgi:ribosome biogenesis GTPase / thiamine phosphate phosphatase
LQHSALIDLGHIGWDEERQAYLEEHHPNLEPARVTAEHKGSYAVLTARGEMSGEITGRMRHDALLRTQLPAVGDWVAAQLLPGERRSVIEAVLPRRSSFSRDVAGFRTEEQVLAANVDLVFILGGLDGDLNLRRIERFLTLAWESGAVPVVILTKTDMCTDVDAAVADVSKIAPGVDVFPVCGLDGSGFEPIRALFDKRRTVALLGSSGVGKSTLINLLLGRDAMVTKEVRWDGKGRHTTSHRQLIALPDGGAVIDTPGLRELRLWDADEGIDTAFSDVAAIAGACRFGDCTHDHEPDCAVLAAVEDGSLDQSRLAGYRKLVRELAALERKKDIHLQREMTRKFKRASSDARARSRERW